MIKFSRWLDNLYEPGTQFYLRGNNIANPNAGQQLAAWGGDLAGSMIAAPLVASTAAQIGAGLYNAAAPEALDIPGESLANLAALGAMGYGAYRGISRYNRIGGMAGLKRKFADQNPINTAAPAAAVAAPVATAAAAAHRPSSDFPYFDPYAAAAHRPSSDFPYFDPYAGASVAPPMTEPPPGSFTVNYDRPPAGMVAPPLVDGPPPFMGGISVAPPLAEPPTGMRFMSPSMGYSEVPGMGATSPRTSIKMSGAYPSLAASLGMGQPVVPPAGVVARVMDASGPEVLVAPPPAALIPDAWPAMTPDTPTLIFDTSSVVPTQKKNTYRTWTRGFPLPPGATPNAVEIGRTNWNRTEPIPTPSPANILQDVLTATPILAPPVAPASVGKFASAVEPVIVEAFDPAMYRGIERFETDDLNYGDLRSIFQDEDIYAGDIAPDLREVPASQRGQVRDALVDRLNQIWSARESSGMANPLASSGKSARGVESEPVTLTPSYSGINLTSPQTLAASDYAGLAIQSGAKVKDIIADDFNRLYKPGWDNDSRVAQMFQSIVKEAEDNVKIRASIGGGKAAFDYI